ncbi:MAG: hypothetical protein KBG33_04185 [Paludibacteraceae bacterium]|nr:hypothetical protein [Paludibacteraceae bacterium]MBP8966576.1 hypothetical protein [Paludibacteraceae bacterium]
MKQVNSIYRFQFQIRAIKTSSLIEGFIIGVWCGDNRFLYIEFTRNDAAQGKILVEKIHRLKTFTNASSPSSHRLPTNFEEEEVYKDYCYSYSAL